MSRQIQKFYDIHADNYDSLWHGDFAERWIIRPAILKALGNVRGKKILDAGSGTGHYAKHFARQGAYVTVIDISPGGQLVLSVGSGTEPVDALAEFKRSPQLQNIPPSGMKDMSYYIWIKKDGSNQLIGRHIPQEFTSVLRQQAIEETRRRALAKLPMRQINSYIDAVQRSKEWNAVSTAELKRIGDAGVRQRLLDLSAQFQQAEDRFNTAYKTFQETERAIAERQNSLAILAKIGSAVAILQSAIQAKDLLWSKGGAPVNMKGTPEADLPVLIQYTQTTTNALTNYHQAETITIKARAADLRAADKALKDAWKQQNAQLPPGDIQIPRY